MEYDNFSRPEDADDKDRENKRKKKSVRFRGIASLEDAEPKTEKSRQRPPKRFNESLAGSILGTGSEDRPDRSSKTEQDRPDREAARPIPTAEDLTAERQVAAPTDHEQPSTTGLPDESTRTGAGEALRQETDDAAEIFISLDGTEAEHVVPLHDRTGTEIPEDRPYRRRQSAEADTGISFRPQPEQQHKARQEDASVPGMQTEPAVANADNGREAVSDDGPVEQGSLSPGEAELGPVAGRWNETTPLPVEHMITSGGGSVAPAERPATKREVDQSLARSASIHGQRGVLSGFAFGTWRANRKLRRQQKTEAKSLHRQADQLDRISSQNAAVMAAQERRNAVTEHRFAALEKQTENRPATVRPEKLPHTQKGTQAEVEEKGREQPARLPDRRRETSAWHSIEVDNKTGKLVEAPSFEYGHEYYRERAAENGPKDKRNALAGEMAIAAATGAKVIRNSGQDSAVSDGQGVPDATSQGPPSNVRDKAKAAVRSATGSFKNGGSQTGPIWPWAVALLAIIVCIVWLI